MTMMGTLVPPVGLTRLAHTVATPPSLVAMESVTMDTAASIYIVLYTDGVYTQRKESLYSMQCLHAVSIPIASHHCMTATYSLAINIKSD